MLLRDVDVLDTYLGRRDQLDLGARFLITSGVRLLVDEVHPLDNALAAMERLASSAAFGKVVVTVDQ